MASYQKQAFKTLAPIWCSCVYSIEELILTRYYRIPCWRNRRVMSIAQNPVNNVNSGNFSNAFPNNPAEYFAACPSDMLAIVWLFHPANPHAFEEWVRSLISDVLALSQLFTWTFCGQLYLAKKYGITTKWLRTIIKRLIAIGVVQRRRSRRNRRAATRRTA